MNLCSLLAIVSAYMSKNKHYLRATLFSYLIGPPHCLQWP